jgi:hypothetical protein
MDSMPSAHDASSRAVHRWLERKAKESMRRSVVELTAQLRAEQETQRLLSLIAEDDPRCTP